MLLTRISYPDLCYNVGKKSTRSSAKYANTLLLDYALIQLHEKLVVVQNCVAKIDFWFVGNLSHQRDHDLSKSRLSA